MAKEFHKIGIAIISALLAMSAIAFATPVQNVTKEGLVVNLTYGGPAGDTFVANGGNVSIFNVNGTIGTSVWVGITGNVSHQLVLGGATSAFYTWSGTTASSGTVLFANHSDIAWGSVAASTATNKEEEDAALGLDTARADNVTNTFATNNSASIDLGGVVISVAAAQAVNSTSNGGTDWQTVLLVQGSTKIYAGPIQQANQDFAGSLADFQVMVPVNASGGPRTYHLFADLS